MPPMMPKCMPGQMPGQPAAAPAPSPDTVICTVDGEAILQKDIDEELSRSVLRSQRVPPQQMAMVRSRFGAQAEKMLVERKLLAGAARKAGGEVSVEELAARWKEIETGMPKGTTREQLLQRSGMTLEKAEEEIQLGIRIERLLKKHAPVAEVTDEDIRKHYDEFIDRFKTKAQVRARHILLKVERTATDEQKAAVKKQIDDIRAELTKADGGKDFAALAGEHSACPSSAKGGDLGFFGRGQMVPEFDEFSFTLEPGAVSEPFLTQFGYHIMQVDEKREAGTRPFDEVKDGIRKQIEGSSRQKAQAAYIDTLRTTAKIERPATK